MPLRSDSLPLCQGINGLLEGAAWKAQTNFFEEAVQLGLLALSCQGSALTG
jgi:hypothetical protein